MSECKQMADKKTQDWKNRLTAANAAFCQANTTENGAGPNANNQARNMGGAGKVACKGADLNGMKAKGLEPMKNMDCKIEGCESFPTASQDASDIEKECRKSQAAAAKEQADQTTRQGQNQQSCDENKKNEKNEDKLPQVPPFSPPPEEKDEKPKENPPPQLAAPPSGISTGKDPEKSNAGFDKLQKKKENTSHADGGGDPKFGHLKNQSGTNSGLTKSGNVIAAANSKVDGGGGGGFGSSGSSRSDADKKKHAGGAGAGTDEKPIELGGANPGSSKGSSGNLLGVNPTSEEFDELKKEIEGSPKELIKETPMGNSSTAANQGISQNDGPTIFQLTHDRYMSLWKRAQF